MKKNLLLVLSLLISFVVAAPLFAAEVKLIPSGNRVFILQGYDIPNVSGIEAVINYENMQKPQVQRGTIVGNASFFAANVNIPNEIRLATISNNQFAGTGSIVIISFEPIAGKKGSARLTKIKLATESSSFNPATSTAAVADPTPEEKTPEDPANPPKDPTPPNNPPNDPPNDPYYGSTTVGSRSPGTITMPTDGTSKTDTETEPPPEPQQEPTQYQQSEETRQYASQDTQPAEESQGTQKAPGEQKFSAHQSLIDQFRDFKEEKTPKTLITLVEGFSIPGVKQEPSIVLSDGTTGVKVYLDLPSAGKQSPNFALKGAKLVSLKNDEKGKWVIEAMPAKNASDVRVTALQDEAMTEIPLTVAQPVSVTAVSPEGKWDEASFALFLKERGSEKDPRFDLNGDGVRNHVDDYIYTVNHVLRKVTAKQAPAADEKKQQPAPQAGKEAQKPAPPTPPAAPAVKPKKSK